MSAPYKTSIYCYFYMGCGQSFAKANDSIDIIIIFEEFEYVNRKSGEVLQEIKSEIISRTFSGDA